MESYVAQGCWQHLVWSLGHSVPHRSRVRVPCFSLAPLTSALVLQAMGRSGKRVAEAQDRPILAL